MSAVSANVPEGENVTMTVEEIMEIVKNTNILVTNVVKVKVSLW